MYYGLRDTNMRVKIWQKLQLGHAIYNFIINWLNSLHTLDQADNKHIFPLANIMEVSSNPTNKT